MKRYLIVLTAVATMTGAHAADPLRVYIRGGKKSHGPGAHEHEKFLNDWVPLLKDRGIDADGGMDLPTDDQLAKTDVVIFHAQEGGTIPPSRWGSFDEYLKRGGGVVVLHAAAVSLQPDHWKTVTGGTWRQGATKWKEGPMDLYYVENQRITDQHPITMGASNFHLDDEIYYDMDLSPDVRVLATSYTPNVKEGRKPAEDGKVNIYDIQPQMWTYERTVEGGSQPCRAFVSIPGHLYVTFARPNYRAIVMRGIAWAGKRADVNEFVKPEELSALTYPEGGPQKAEVTREHLEVHPDFNLTLVAAEPLITKPMNFDWAPDGSMWVAETPEYPNGRRGMRPDYRGKEWKDHGGIDPEPGRQDRPGRDKISRLVDTDGDGVMDKKEVFYEGLDLVTGLVFYKDGVIVTQAPDILWLRDTDHDGKADKIEKLYGNLGTSDTHAVINNPRWGWDGWIYATHGYSASGNVVNAKGEKMDNIGSGVVRFKPDGSKIEQYSSKGGNTWGLQITADNRVMWTQPTSGTILEHVVLPEYALSRGKWGNTPSFNVVIGSPKTWPAMSWDQMAYRQIDFVGSFTATAGCAIYDGGSWPEEYNGDYFTTEPTINIVHHERLTPKGSSYEGNKLPGREKTEFIRSTDMWWRPIEARVGPDGAVYIGDFYNQAVIHNDTRGPDHNNVNAAVRPDRDHYFGRIWRLDHKQAKKLPVPDLSKADPAALVRALANPNRSVRMTASRLLADANPAPGAKPVPGSPVWKQNYGVEDMLALVADTSKPAPVRIAALWTLNSKHSAAPAVLAKVLGDADPDVRRNAALIVENKDPVIAWGNGEPDAAPAAAVQTALIGLVSDPDAQVRVAALRALAAGELSPAGAGAIIAAWPKFDDDHQKSAAVGALAGNSAAAIAAILDSGSADLAPLASLLVQGIAEKNDGAAASALVISLAAQPASADTVKNGILDTLSKSLKATPEMTPELSTALTKLLGSGVSASVLPLAAQWDKAGALKGAMDSLIADLFGKLTKGSDDERFAAGQSLISLRSANADALPAVLKLVTGDASPMLKARLITALSETGEASVGEGIATAFASLPAEAQTVAFNVILKRPEWALAFLDAVKAKTVDPAVLGPANAFRLRTHPNKAVAKRAAAMLDELMPGAKAKAEIIAKLAPEVEKKGNMEQGKLIFTTTCATCHKFGDAGSDVAPNLTGMGAHGAGELLAAIVDPNAEVDPSFTAWNIETNDGQVFAGVIARENPTSLFLKFQGGEKEIRTADIKSRINTGRSLMPEGFDGLGPEILRDIITYMQAADGGGKYRTLDLRNAFTTTTALGLYMSQDIKEQSLDFRKTGTVPVEGIPFNIVGPEKAPNNIIVLQGGPDGTYCSTLPKKVEIQVGGFKANRLHFLGGVTGWGYQPGADKSDVLKITVHTTAGQRETIMCQNGVEFSDYINRIDVPGSKFVRGLVNDHQVRWFTKPLSGPVEIERITLESVGGMAAPTVVAITAELAEGESAAVKTEPAAPAGDAIQWGEGTKVLVVGGGSSHNFQKFFNEADLATLTAAGGVTCHYTEDVAVTAKELPGADVLVLSTNQGSFASFAFRKALEDHANAGKGIVFIHPGMWYNMREWPEFNKVYIGGGARGHDKIQEFEVKSTGIQHPVMKGIPDTFKITDELYYATPDPEGTPIEVLATATSPLSGKTFPSIYVVKHPKTRIVCIAPGHDERVHSLDVYQTLLTNAVKWVSEKK